MTITLIILAALGMFALFMHWITGSVGAHLTRYFEKEFPDRCFTCVYHELGQREGALDPNTKVPAHDCKETRA
jgi:hypothetical protein